MITIRSLILLVGENAGGTASFLFSFDKAGFHSSVFSPEGEAKALDEHDIHLEVRYVKRGISVIDEATDFFKNSRLDPLRLIAQLVIIRPTDFLLHSDQNWKKR